MTEPELTEAEWLHDLRTTDLPQTRVGVLYDSVEVGWCCLGRACELDKRIRRVDEDYTLDGELINGLAWVPGSATSFSATPWSWMTPHQADDCTMANDIVEMSFAEIADWWEAGRPDDDDGRPARVAS